ncbi:MAG: FitA-like ribbon-helix-helix domain-containing protein [Dermatophilaceae bacterium]
MTAITVRRLPEGVKQRLRLRAAANGRSMEAEARSILVAALDADRAVDFSWVDSLVRLGDDLGGVEVPAVADEPAPAADLGRT